jgi:hypothetical protein
MAVITATVEEVYEKYTNAPSSVQFYIDGVEERIVEIGPATDGKGGFLLVDADNQHHLVDSDETMWLIGEKWADDVQ